MDEIDKLLSKPTKKRPVWHEVREKLFLKAYIEAEGNCSQTARDIGVSRMHVWRMRKIFGLPIAENPFERND